MTNAAEEIARLRKSLAQAGLENPEKHARVSLGCADAALKGGLQKGALHEVFAASGHEAAATGFALVCALRLSGKRPFFWIRQDYAALEQGDIAATGLLELGADPSRVFVLAVPDAESALRAASDALSCRALGAVLIETSGEAKIFDDLATSRKLTLAASEQGVAAILLRFCAHPDASAAETRWLIRAAPSKADDEDWGKPSFKTELVRNRHGSTGQWAMEWDCDEKCFRESPKALAEDRGAVVSTALDRPAATAMEGEGRFRAVA